MDRLTGRDEHGNAICTVDSKDCTGKCSDCNYDYECFKKLADYEDLEEQGRLLILPCKAGDTVYRIWKTEGREPVITSHYMTDIGMVVRWMHYFGNRVFLTYEEAEAALRGD